MTGINTFDRRQFFASFVMGVVVIFLIAISIIRYSYGGNWFWIACLAIAFFLVEHYGNIKPLYDSKLNLSFSDIVLVASVFILDPLSILIMATVAMAIEDRIEKVSFKYSYLNVVTVGFSSWVAAFAVSSPISATNFTCIAVAGFALFVEVLSDSFTFALFGEYKETKTFFTSKPDNLARLAAMTFGLPAGILGAIAPWAILLPIPGYVITLYLYRNLERLNMERDNLNTLADSLDFSIENSALAEIDEHLLNMAKRITNNDQITIDYEEPNSQMISCKFGSPAVGYRWFTVTDVNANEKKWRHSSYKKGLNAVGTIANRSFENYTLRQQLKLAAERDPLTGLYNRRTLEDIMNHEMAQYRRGKIKLTVLYLDLDRFKPINDEFGHIVGDHALKTVVNRITKEVREEDIVARVGGDEFVILCRNIEIADAYNLSERITTSIKRPIVAKDLRPGSIEVQVSVSIGICETSEENSSTEIILNSADKNMYQVKRKNDNDFNALGA